MRQELNRMYSA